MTSVHCSKMPEKVVPFPSPVACAVDKLESFCTPLERLMNREMLERKPTLTAPGMAEHSAAGMHRLQHLHSQAPEVPQKATLTHPKPTSEFSLNGSAIKTVSLIKTFRGISARDYDYIPPYAIEGETTTIHIRENKCTSKKSNDSTLTEVSNTTLEYLTSSLSTKLIPAVYLSAVLLGVPSNAIILWMLLFRIRSVCTAVLYTNLAVSDLLFCIMLPFKIAYHINGNNWIFGETMCRTATAVFYGNMYCSILLLTCISVSRYVAIVHPFTYKSLPKRAYATAACAAVWAIVFLYMLPLAIMQQSYHVKQLDIYTCHDVHSACETISSFQFYYYVSLAVFGFLIPLATIVFCYVSIIRTLKTHEWFWWTQVVFSWNLGDHVFIKEFILIVLCQFVIHVEQHCIWVPQSHNEEIFCATSKLWEEISKHVFVAVVCNREHEESAFIFHTTSTTPLSCPHLDEHNKESQVGTRSSSSGSNTNFFLAFVPVNTLSIGISAREKQETPKIWNAVKICKASLQTKPINTKIYYLYTKLSLNEMLIQKTLRFSTRYQPQTPGLPFEIMVLEWRANKARADSHGDASSFPPALGLASSCQGLQQKAEEAVERAVPGRELTTVVETHQPQQGFEITIPNIRVHKTISSPRANSDIPLSEHSPIVEDANISPHTTPDEFSDTATRWPPQAKKSSEQLCLPKNMPRTFTTPCMITHSFLMSTGTNALRQRRTPSSIMLPHQLHPVQSLNNRMNSSSFTSSRPSMYCFEAIAWFGGRMEHSNWGAEAGSKQNFSLHILRGSSRKKQVEQPHANQILNNREKDNTLQRYLKDSMGVGCNFRNPSQEKHRRVQIPAGHSTGGREQQQEEVIKLQPETTVITQVTKLQYKPIPVTPSYIAKIRSSTSNLKLSSCNAELQL
ncbi:hypothetical protein IHE44_0011480 [Lamprotornis superbus]|uniref:G-protein coupled receptors family 1 profile domain-containing protein n=1 Tax=Lamprotornis superbus TaxID=245042 RepID=A0A835TP37_9PASS|nr:hypothetical protein IHE44_0011480 [Lamprotornis superbus]